MSGMVSNMAEKFHSPLHQLLDQYGIYTTKQLRELTGLSTSQAWNLWHGAQQVGSKTARLLHATCGIPFDELMTLPAELPEQPPARTPIPESQRKISPPRPKKPGPKAPRQKGGA